MAKKNRIDLKIRKSAIVDDGDGTIRFQGGLTLSDESEQLNGTRYDHATTDLSRYTGEVFAEHDYSVTSMLGNAFGVAKQAGKIVAEGIRFAVRESAMARFYYEMMRSGFARNVSIGTVGPPPDEDGVYHNAVFKEFSIVGLGNNENARVSELNALAKNTIQKSEADGLSTSELREFLLKNHVQVDAKNDEEQDPKPADPAPVETPDPQPTNDNNGEDSMTEEEKKAKAAEDAKAAEEQKKADEAAQAANAAAIATAVAEAVKPLSEELAAIKSAFDNGAAEPAFNTNGTPPAGAGGQTPTDKNQFAAMDWRELTQMQVVNFFKASKEGDEDARKTLAEINKYHKEQLVEKGLAKNVVGLGDFGNFVTNPELITEIQGFRSDYSDLLSVFPYRETNALKMAWLERSGDVDMQPVELCDDDEDGNLKPISDYSATPKEKSLEELAAVTPVCNAATIFLAADLLEDVAAGYRTSYDRNLARGVIGVLELAAEDNDSASFAYTGDPTVAADSLAGLEEIRQAVFAISQGDNGILVLNYASFGIIHGLLMASGNGGALAVRSFDGGVNTIWGKRYVLVPNDLMPTLGDTGSYKSWQLDGATVTVNHAIFNADPAFWRGRQNGGLRYDLSTEAAYELPDGTVRSAYQRNEVVLRGSHFRGAAYTDNSRVSAVRVAAVIS